MPKVETAVQGQRYSMTQPVLKVCRICFAMNCDLHLLYENVKLCKDYEAVTGLKLADEEDLPPYLCTNCAGQLMNCAHFRHRSLQAHMTLLDILKNHDRISVESIQAAIRTTNRHSDNEHTEGEIILGNVKIEIKPEDDTVDPIAIELGDEIKTDYIPDVGADDDLVDEAVVAPCVETNDVVKEEVVDAPSVNDVGDSELGTGHYVVLDGGPPSRQDTLKLGAGEGMVKDLNQTEDIEVNEKSTQNITLSCDLCGYENDDEAQFLCHLRAHTNKGHSCDTCDYNTGSDKTKLGSIVQSCPVQHSCDMCGKSFSTTRGLAYHMHLHLGKEFSCDLCDKSYSRKSYLKYHMLIHLGKAHTCDVCKKAFPSKSEVNMHMRIHSSVKPFSCEVCRKSFVRKTCLERHVLVHSSDKPYSCEICHKSYSQIRYLRLHLRIHSDDKPYSCDACEKSYRSKSDLKRHMFMHSDDKPYSCEICNKSFFQPMGLKRHEKIHSGAKPYSCEVCQNRYRSKTEVESHMLVHSGDKEYACKLCKKTFQIKNFRRHMLMHSGDKPFTCEICRVSFSRRNTLNTHMLVHSDDKRDVKIKGEVKSLQIHSHGKPSSSIS